MRKILLYSHLKKRKRKRTHCGIEEEEDTSLSRRCRIILKISKLTILFFFKYVYYIIIFILSLVFPHCHKLLCAVRQSRSNQTPFWITCTDLSKHLLKCLLRIRKMQKIEPDSLLLLLTKCECDCLLFTFNMLKLCMKFL